MPAVAMTDHGNIFGAVHFFSDAQEAGVRIQAHKPEPVQAAYFFSGSSSRQLFKHRFSPIIILTTCRAKTNRLERLRALADEVKI